MPRLKLSKTNSTICKLLASAVVLLGSIMDTVHVCQLISTSNFASIEDRNAELKFIT